MTTLFKHRVVYKSPNLIMRSNGPLMKLSHVNKICHAMIGGSRISFEGSVDEEVYRRHFHHVTVDNPWTLCAFSDINYHLKH